MTRYLILSAAAAAALAAVVVYHGAVATAIAEGRADTARWIAR